MESNQPPQYPQPSNQMPPYQQPSGQPTNVPPTNAAPSPYSPYPQQPQAFSPAPQQSVDLQQAIKGFKLPDWLIAGGALAFLIASLLPWYAFSYSYPGLTGLDRTSGSGSVSAWNHWSGQLAGLLAIATLVFFALRLFKVQLPAMQVKDNVIYMALGGLMALFSLIYLSQTNASSFNEAGFSAGPSIGLFLGVLSALAIVAGGYLRKDAFTQP